MRNEEEISTAIEKFKRIILDPKTRINTREQTVHMLRALEWVLEDSSNKMEQRLNDVGIRKTIGPQTQAE